MKKRVSIFGSTGSIGTSTLNVIRNNLDLFEVTTLVAGNNVDRLIEQINEFNPKHVYIISEENSKLLKSKFKDLDIYYGEQGMNDISNLTDYDIAVSALVGISGLEPTYNMIKNGKTVALANKEVLVTGGELIINTAKEMGATLLTVDSEHSAIMQCLNRLKNNLVKLDLFEVRNLEFEKPDLDKFKCLKLAFEAIKKGHSYQVVLNAADEVLVNAFLEEKIKYIDIPNLIEIMLNNHKKEKLDTIDKILDLDKRARKETEKLVEERKI